MADKNDILDGAFAGNRKAKSGLDEGLLLAYLDGKLSPAQQHEVEEWLGEASMEADAIEGLKSLPVRETKSMVDHLNRELQKKVGRKKHRALPARPDQVTIIAIALVLFLAVLVYFLIKLIAKHP